MRWFGWKANWKWFCKLKFSIRFLSIFNGYIPHIRAMHSTTSICAAGARSNICIHICTWLRFSISPRNYLYTYKNRHSVFTELIHTPDICQMLYFPNVLFTIHQCGGKKCYTNIWCSSHKQTTHENRFSTNKCKIINRYVWAARNNFRNKPLPLTACVCVCLKSYLF